MREYIFEVMNRCNNNSDISIKYNELICNIEYTKAMVYVDGAAGGQILSTRLFITQ